MLAHLVLLLLAADLSPETAPRLKVAWTAETHATPPNARAGKIAAFEATPVFSGGLLFVITPFNQVIAMDPATGTLIWQTRLSEQPHDGNYQITSPPVIAGAAVIVGSSIGDNGRAELDRGTVRAFDAKNGKLRWSWDPTPAGKTGAANAWAPMAVDAGRDLVFVPTGSASPDFYGGSRPDENRYANSVVALRASTGQLVWAFQVVHHDLWDYDVASRPELVDIQGRPAIGVLTKIGHYFALDRLTGKPLLPVEERAVPRSDVEGESASPTQPVPASGVFTEQRFVPREGWCADELRKLRHEGVFTPPSLGGTLVFPGNVGGANWGSGAYDLCAGSCSSPRIGWRPPSASFPAPRLTPPITAKPANDGDRNTPRRAARLSACPARPSWRPTAARATRNPGGARRH